MFLIIIINVFYNVAVEFFFCTYQRFDSSTKCKGEKWKFFCHVLVKFPDFL